MSDCRTTLGVPESERFPLIKDILGRGNIVVFTNMITGVVKKVREWNLDAEGDLTAFYSTGRNAFVCPTALEYEVSEETPDGVVL